METQGTKARACPRCGALNSAEFDRCIRCAEPLGSLAAGLQAVKGGIDARQLWGTKILIGMTLFVFTAQLVGMAQQLGQRGKSIGDIFLSGGSTADLWRFGALSISPSEPIAPLRLLSAVFVHFGVLHVGMNMLGLLNLGRIAEPGVGTARFVLSYLVCGVVGFGIDVAWTHFISRQSTFTAGASGAIFGVNGLILGWLIHGRDRRWRTYAVQAVFYAVILRVVLPINVAAHLGGLLCGAAFGFYFAWRPRPKTLLLANIGAALGLALSVLSLIMAQRSIPWNKRLYPDVTSEPDALAPDLPDRSPRHPLRIRSAIRAHGQIDSSHKVAV